jgi:hypothetical protein
MLYHYTIVHGGVKENGLWDLSRWLRFMTHRQNNGIM